MPSRTPTSIDPPSLIVVTGANGFIAQHCISRLLSSGYRVLGTVRSSSKASLVHATHSHNPNLSTAIVPDITSTSAYLSAFSSLHPSAIFHLASPFTYDTTDYESDLMIPAVRGALSLLEAAAQTHSVKRVVHTNSFACIYDAAAGPAPGKTYSAEDWSPLTYEDGVHAGEPATAYRASKTAAEKAGWEYVRTERPGFDLVSLCPAMVFGGFLDGALPRGGIKELNTSNALVYSVVGGGKDGALPPTKGPVWVDVRDVAEAHVRCLTKNEAGGGRFLLAAGVYCNQEIADVARKVLIRGKGSNGVAGEPWKRVPVGEPGRREAHLHFGVDVKKTEDVLGMKWRGLDVCLESLLPQIYEMEKF